VRKPMMGFVKSVRNEKTQTHTYIYIRGLTGATRQSISFLRAT
jgi:hypothetical protein